MTVDTTRALPPGSSIRKVPWRVPEAKALLSLNSYQVKIDDFELKGSVLAPGVVDSDPQIRENDEVIVLGKKAFGVGRAKMSGWEMVESGRGVAVDVRHIY